MLASRLRTATILLAIVLGFIYLDVSIPLASIPGLWMVPIYLVLCLGTAYEASAIVRNAWQLPVYWVPSVIVASAALPAIPEFFQFLGISDSLDPSIRSPLGRLAIVCLGNWFLTSILGVAAILSYKDRQQAIGWLVSVGLLLYVSVSTSFWWIIRQIGEPKTAMLNIIGIALVTKMADSGAYFAGKNFGRTRLAPVLSPKKTWEGLLGGWITACVCSATYFTWLGHAAPDMLLGWRILGAVLLGTTLTWMGLLGDLIESMIKRSGAVKDSGSSFAGLGGVWDVTDSLIPAGAVGLLAILLGWI